MDSREAVFPKYTTYCVLMASLEAFCNGYVIGSPNVPGTATHICENGLNAVAAKGLPDCLPMNTALWGFAVSSFCVGGLIASLFGGAVQEKLGRRLTMIINTSGFIIGSLLCSVAAHQAMFIIGRIICGLSCGLGSLVVPTYIGEVSTIKGRGTYGSCNQLGVVIGILVSSGIGMPLANVPLWRVNYAIPAFPAILQAFMMPSCVESPRWLIAQSRIADARNALQRLRGSDSKIDQELFEIVEGQYGTAAATDILRNGELGDEGVKIPSRDEANVNGDANFEEKGEREAGGRATYSMLDVLRDPVTRRIGFTVFVHHIIQQLSGMNAVMYYSTTIFNLAFDEQMAQSMTIVDTAVNLIATLIAIAIIDKLGRRPLMMIAEAGTCIFSVLLVIGYKTNTPGLLVASVFLYVASFAVGIGPIPWLITSEMTPTYAASAVGAASTCINWCMNFLIGQIFPVIFAAIEGWSFLIFAVICLLAFIFTFFFLPETRGRSLESIVKEYEKYRN